MEQTTAVQVSTWKQLEHIFQCNLSSSNAIKWLRPSSRTVLHRNFNELRLALSDSPLYLKGIVPSPHVFPALHFACNALNVSRVWPSEILESLVDPSFRSYGFTRVSQKCMRRWINSSWTLVTFWISAIGNIWGRTRTPS